MWEHLVAAFLDSQERGKIDLVLNCVNNTCVCVREGGVKGRGEGEGE